MRRVTFLRALILASALLAATPASAEIRIIQSPGGQVGPFLDLFEKVRESGERVVIDGPCLSACTLVLSIVPGERICVTKTRRARLPCGALGRSARTLLRRAGSIRCGACGLSRPGARLDQSPRRPLVAVASAEGTRPRRDLSALPVMIDGRECPAKLRRSPASRALVKTLDQLGQFHARADEHTPKCKVDLQRRRHRSLPFQVRPPQFLEFMTE
ncbi:hypothetical protein ACVWXM_005252 [Bradyrhizobium sp. GM7.3]